MTAKPRLSLVTQINKGLGNIRGRPKEAWRPSGFDSQREAHTRTGRTCKAVIENFFPQARSRRYFQTCGTGVTRAPLLHRSGLYLSTYHKARSGKVFRRDSRGVASERLSARFCVCVVISKREQHSCVRVHLSRASGGGMGVQQKQRQRNH